MSHALLYAANCSMLFTELPLLERPAAAKEAGFSAIEFWWPWPDQPVPPDSVVDGFVGAIREADIPLIGLNFFAGDLAGPDAGVLSLPARSSEFRDNIAVVAGIGEALGVAAHNALYGNRIDGVPPEQQDELATENLILAAEAIAGYSATVLVEPVSGPKPYPLRTADRGDRGRRPGRPGQRRLPLRPVPSGQQRRRHRRRPRAVRVQDRPRADRRPPGPRRARQRPTRS